MIIKRLVMHNFGVYAGANEFDFNSNKPIVLIGGMNGRGKTTFLEAVLLSLYGSNSFAYKESKYKTYGQYLKSHINQNDHTLEAYVELSFQMNQQENDYYEVKREWTGITQRIHETISVKKNGEHNDFLTQNWPMFIENLLPSGLSNYFFFDGEKIAELAVDDTDAQMKESIRSMLGISVLDTLKNDINRGKSKSSKSNDDDKLKKLDELKKLKETAEANLAECDSKIATLSKELEQTKISIEQQKMNYIANGGDVVEKKQELVHKKNVLQAQLEKNKENLIEEASGALPLVLVKDLLCNIKEQAEYENTQKNGIIAADTIKALLKNYEDKDNSDVQRFVEYIESNALKQSVPVYNLNEEIVYRLNELLDQKLEEQRNSAKEVLREKAKLNKKSDEIDSFLSVDINENEVVEIYKLIKQLEQKEISLTVELESLQSQRGNLNGNVLRTTTEFNRCVEETLSAIELSDDSERMLKYSNLALKIIDRYTVKLQERKVESLASVITACYKKLANKQNLIETIKMNPVSLDLKYFNKENEEVEKASLSAGEKQLMVISILWGLALCSKKKLPVIIDTPLSRLDSTHRTSLIQTYFPQASEQTIILSTDSEIDRHYYDMMAENVGDEFTLEYDDNTKSTSIHRGYFMSEEAS